MKSFRAACRLSLLVGLSLAGCHGAKPEVAEWRLDSAADWEQGLIENQGFELNAGMAVPVADEARCRSVLHAFDRKVRATSLVVGQSPVWHDWEPADKVGPVNLEDAPVLLIRGERDYWLFGLYGEAHKRAGFQSVSVEVEGFDVPLVSTPFPRQYDAPGGLKPGLGGYHAWQSRDMVHWVHHGSVTERFSRWVTTAEMVGGKTYIYYDYPNDQDPHVYVDDELGDGMPGKDMGMAFKDPSHGSDCAVIRDLDGSFHLIHEDWSPINARTHAWDSPLAGHAVSRDGLGGFEIMPPAVDERTTPTGEVASYLHPHWKKEHPDWNSNVGEYQVHEPEQNAYGDWAAISIGGRYYLFGDYHAVDGGIRIGWFTSEDVNEQFEFCGAVGDGHPDPDIGFAEGRFYLINQTRHDYVSPGPWVGDVEARVGVDTVGDGEVDHWSGWQLVRESYERVEGFSKQVRRIPAAMDLDRLPPGYGFAFEIRVHDATANASKPILDHVRMAFSR